jgi:hypothetical protein
MFSDGEYHRVSTEKDETGLNKIFKVSDLDPDGTRITTRTNTIDILDWERHPQRVQMFDYYPLPDRLEKVVNEEVRWPSTAILH